MAGNWFVALQVEAGDWWARVSRPPPSVRLFAPEDLHLTVAFLGPVATTAAEEAFRLAGTWPRGAVTITLGDVAPMGDPRRPSALSAIVEAGRDSLAAAIVPIRDGMRARAGVGADPRPPLPHVTIARPARRASRREVTEAVAWARGLDLGRPALRLTRLVLYTRADDRRARLFREHAGVDISQKA